LARSSRPRRSWRARRPPAGSHEISFAAVSGDPPRRSHHFLSFSYANPDAHVHRERPSDTPAPSRPLFVRAANAGRVASLPETRREEIAVAARASVKRTGLASRFKVPTGSALICSSAPLDLRWRSTEVWREKSLCQTERLCRPCAVLTTPTSLSRMTRESPL
jgi:hypothetical protein